jgi:hypothetical protein
MKGNMSSSVGNVTRLYRGELPYVRGYIKHYIGLGVDHFYFVFNTSADHDLMREELQEYKGIYTPIIEGEGRSVNHSLKLGPDVFSTDYLFNLDADEFIYLGKGEKIADFLTRRKPVYGYMQWVMTPRDFSRDTLSTGFEAHAGKTFARRDSMVAIRGPHWFDMKDDIESVEYNDIKFAHYWGRSFEDILIKCVYQNLENKKTTSLREMEDLLREGKLPERLRLLASLVSHNRTTPVPTVQNDFLNTETEERLLQVCTQTFRDDIKALYISYKEKLDYKQHVAIYPRCGSLFRLMKLLP